MKKEIKTKIVEISKENVFFRKILRYVLHIYRYTRFKLRGIGKKVDNHLIIFHTFNGKAYSDTPKAIYKYMQENSEYDDYKYIWAFKNPEKYKYLENNKNTKVVKSNSKEFEECLQKAKYWIFNYRAGDHQYPKKNQVFVQCWHGTPLKKLGYDLKDTHNAMNSEEEIHKKYKVDAKKFKYIISPSKFASEKFISAWNLEKTNMTDKVLEKGYPRNDFLYNFKEDDVKRIKQELNIPDDKKVILYAPTWRDDQHQAGVGYTYKTEVDFDMLQKNLEKDYVLLFRAHYLVANSFEFDKYKGFIYNVSEVDDINELYIISDILVTDYSSVFFDYANLKRPMLFYMYDFDKYKDDLRGFYIDLEELPGKITKTEADLIEAIKETNNFEYNDKYKKFNEKYNYLDDGQATKRVVEEIIK